MAAKKGHRGQKPLREGEVSLTTGVRLSEDLNAHYEKVAERLRDRFPDCSKSAVMRSVLEYYSDFAEVVHAKLAPPS